MDLTTLLAEAQPLIRPWMMLTIEPSTPDQPIAGYWGELNSESGPVLIVDCAYLPMLTEATSLIIEYAAELNYSVKLSSLSLTKEQLATMQALYAQPATSLPPLDAVLHFGSATIQQWIDSFRDHQGWIGADDVADRELVDGYETLYQAQHPLYRDDAVASLGGWHMVWPDGDWNELLQQQLVLCTYAEAEPWLEVWRTQTGQLHVRERFS
ncbi:hypothetical protein [Herpetosiphon geysericola]|uniref:hypothetical protein n=1 Tax=Herpetosiphon geysericola TaxID=70996 RepID=UPI0006C90131|nr:hypothetical protein [Herpetosiphon geysericola]